MNIAELSRVIVSVLSDDLLEKDRRADKLAHPENYTPVTGHCSIATEAIFWFLGWYGSAYKPMNIQHEGDSHWYLLSTADGTYIDLTEAQFTTPVPHSLGRGRGWPTRRNGAIVPPPSKRAQILIERVIAAHPHLQLKAA